MRRLPRHRLIAPMLVGMLLLTACGDGSNGEGSADGSDDSSQTSSSNGEVAPEDQLAVSIASFDLAVGADQRVIAGLLSSDLELLAFGEVTFQLAFLGDGSETEGELSQEVPASFLGVPGMEPEGDDDTPRLLSGEQGSGVYAGSVDLDEAGFYGLLVSAELADGRVLQGESTFQVREAPEIVTVGDPAPRSRNHIAADAEAGTVEPAAIDSRAGGTDPTIPDPHLHDTVIEDALDAGRPLVVAVTTPVYCMSRFCGPLTEVISDIALDYEEVADFVHLEVWRDHDEGVVNEAAAEWVMPEVGIGGNEPWVFVVDETGTITARWDNVLDVDELIAELEAL